MKLEKYFLNTVGTGVLATADAQGKVNAAVYATPTIIDKDTVAFIMRERLTHDNLQVNPYATFLFTEAGHGARGVRLYLKKMMEKEDPELISTMQRRALNPEQDKALGPKYLVYLTIEKILPLVGSNTEKLAALIE